MERELNADAGSTHVEVMNGGIVASMTRDCALRGRARGW